MFVLPSTSSYVYDLQEHSGGKEYSPRIRLENSSSGETFLSQELDGVSAASNMDSLSKEVQEIVFLPFDLAKLVDVFINDLKQPKYEKPLSIFQLSGLFQAFYAKFDTRCLQLFSREINSGMAAIPRADSLSFTNAKETLSSGLSGIFNRGRNGSENKQKHLLRLSPVGDRCAYLSIFSAEEAQRIRELNRLKIDKYMELCERDVFQRILEVGTSVPGMPKTSLTNGCMVQVLDLFRNSPEFIKYDTLLTTKIKTLRELARSDKLDLNEFLGMSSKLVFDSDAIGDYLLIFIKDCMSPVEKITQLLQIHNAMTKMSRTIGNDDFLPILVYVIIMNPIENLYINILFVRLFRYNQKLVANELFAITNLTAAVSFLENLAYDDLPKKAKDNTSPDEFYVLSDKIKISEIELQEKPQLPRINSYKSLVGSTLDNSLRNIFGKIKSYTPQTPPAPGIFNDAPHEQPKITSPQFRDQNNTPKSSQEGKNTSVSIKLKLDENDQLTLIIPESCRKYRSCEFEDLKLSDMKMVFETYQKLLKALES